MTKEEVNIVCDLLDLKAELMKQIFTAQDLMEVYRKDDNIEGFKYQCGRKHALLNAMTMISTHINKIKNGGING